MRILVTGGAGFIGTRLVEQLLGAGHEVLIVDDLRLGSTPPTGNGRLTVCVAGLGSAIAAHAVVGFGPQAVFHLAAIHYVPYAQANPRETRQVNVGGTKWLLDLLHRVPCRLVVACSSAAVYGFSVHALDEDSALAARDVYGQSKIDMEQLLRAHARAHPDQVVGVARLFNVYGPGDRHPHLVPSVLRHVQADLPVSIGNTWPTRDYVYVDDVASALLRLGAGPPGHAIYNVGTGVATSVADIVVHLAALTGRDVAIETDPTRVRADDGHLVGDSRRLTQALSWTPQVGLRDGLARLVRSHLAVAR